MGRVPGGNIKPVGERHHLTLPSPACSAEASPSHWTLACQAPSKAETGLPGACLLVSHGLLGEPVLSSL